MDRNEQHQKQTILRDRSFWSLLHQQ